MDLSCLFEKSDMIPVIIQDAETKEVLMLGFTNQEAFRLSMETGTAWFWSRSRRQLWNKGETSGNYLHIREVRTDCDTDSLLYLCKPDGPTCHTGARSCFFNEIDPEDVKADEELDEEIEDIEDTEDTKEEEK